MEAKAASPAKGAPVAVMGPPPAASSFRFSVLRDFGKRYLKVHLWLVFFYIVGSLLSQTVLPQQAAIYLGAVTNHFSGTPAEAAVPPDSGPAGANATDLLANYWLWLLFTMSLVVVGFGFQWLVSLFDGKITNAVKSDVFATLLRQSPRFFHENDSDRLTMIVNQYCNQIAGTLRGLLIDPILQLISIVIIGGTIYHSLSGLASGGGATWTVFGVNGVWVMFAATVAFAMTSPWIVNVLGKYLQRDSRAVQEQSLGLATLVGGALKAPEEVQAMRAEPVFARKHTALLEQSLRLQMTQTVTMERINAFSRLPGNIVLAAFLGLAIYLETAGSNGQPGMIVQVALLTPLLMGAIQQLSSFGITVSMAWPPLEMIDNILSSAPPPAKPSSSAPDDTIRPTLEARDLVFSYRPATHPNVLDGVSFSIPSGKVTGLVARPGQGKTTLFRLALRFYEIQGGQLLVGGTPHSDLPLSVLRRHIVLMSQFPAFFYDTVRENMLIAQPGATDEQIEQTARMTGLWDILRRSIGPDPLDQPFAAGAGLSGGQKKLFALTRCLLREPTFLFLDEPTTGMGPLEKFPLIENMRHSLEDKTVVVVDHDIVWQSRFCDHFLVLHEGKIIQSGTAAELLSQPGLFKQLYDESSGGGAPVPEKSPDISPNIPVAAAFPPSAK